MEKYMPIKFSNDKPIFLQVAEIIKGNIISGKFKTNEKLPSVRELALIYSINPNTVQKALQLLEVDGLIVTDRTNGKYVAENSVLIEEQKEILIKNEIDLFFDKMKALGLTEKDVKELIKRREV
jgi:GntR family transcriptional regulator